MTRDEAIEAVTDAFLLTHAAATDPEVGGDPAGAREIAVHAEQVGGVSIGAMLRSVAEEAVDALAHAGLVFDG